MYRIEPLKLLEYLPRAAGDWGALTAYTFLPPSSKQHNLFPPLPKPYDLGICGDKKVWMPVLFHKCSTSGGL